MPSDASNDGHPGSPQIERTDNGACLPFWLRDQVSGSLLLDGLDPNGDLIRNLGLSATLTHAAAGCRRAAEERRDALERVPVGNRFLVFALFPQINVALRLERGADADSAMLSLGRSIINRMSDANLGELAARYGGGGHPGAASVRLEGDVDAALAGIVSDLGA